MTPSDGSFRMAPRPPSRVSRGAMVFAINGLSSLALTLLYGSTLTATHPSVDGPVILAGLVLGILTMLAAAYGLYDSRRWATSVVTPLLLVALIATAVTIASSPKAAADGIRFHSACAAKNVAKSTATAAASRALAVVE